MLLLIFTKNRSKIKRKRSHVAIRDPQWSEIHYIFFMQYWGQTLIMTHIFLLPILKQRTNCVTKTGCGISDKYDRWVLKILLLTWCILIVLKSIFDRNSLLNVSSEKYIVVICNRQMRYNRSTQAILLPWIKSTIPYVVIMQRALLPIS